ncbi:hypothetical protein A3B85_00445 [Candidatus Nomurabacteria bacterium RIFCSPHIGHO2_02_FULL_37_13]|uniref:Uncharacterized protein n=1 Tax=Candidatus Nomurabacteria bacterium RIFCSPHIGHO2_02_FULL_37_13 TaxID=1801750 RepID=A0A1F6W4A8_9BACT|nr:MAG: hypothetical protein A2640_02465 [Candidatus Nomurabacteria bacterium RIFCSPHIGHO2_01_FULL_36_23]OGI76721.1 MAG: hypothetical protein A3B85_00445 [Candidatus Nomurabacteria bacterium RIFCSPHIGHO2_02_FULL_37_13]OGI86973.1 MAG: hypothetical protein A2906_00630 [Candidatus Nomurabacteria bacterium RIFCSPLOWO2_01_FULL_37_25]
MNKQRILNWIGCFWLLLNWLLLNLPIFPLPFGGSFLFILPQNIYIVVAFLVLFVMMIINKVFTQKLLLQLYLPVYV